MEKRQVEDPTEGLLLSTIRVVANHSDGSEGVGTGFFYLFAEAPNGDHVPCIVTNRHVIEGAESIDLVFRKSSADFKRPVQGDRCSARLTELEAGVIGHPNAEIDLCAIPLTSAIVGFNKKGANPWFATVNSSLLISEDFSPPLWAIENVVMVGYPIGLWDDVNDAPIVRRGITASHPALNWRGNQEFLIDAACFPGSSGSPVWLVRERADVGQHKASTDSIYELRLLGVLYAAPQFTAKGEIRVIAIPTATKVFMHTDIPMNLGIVLKAKALNDIDAVIRSKVAAGKLPTSRNNAVLDESAPIPKFFVIPNT